MTRLCPVCECLVETYEPGVSYIKVDGALYHPTCYASTTPLDDNDEIIDDLMKQLVASVQKTCKHPDKDCISTSESGSNTCFVRWYCADCKKSWNDELTPAEYQRLLVLLEDDSPEMERKAS